jgi:tetratricopeptide (TPR) repeat protein
MSTHQNTASAAGLFNQLNAAADLLRKDPAAAETGARDVLRTLPGQQHALLLFASARRLAGDLAGAKNALQTFATANPGLAAVHHELGLVLGELGESGEAASAFRRVVELEPKHPSAWRSLADELAAAGQYQESAKAFAQHARVAIPEVKLLEDMAKLPREQAAMSEAVLKEALKLRSTDVSVMRILADLYIRLGRHQDAIALLSQALELAPDFSVARFMRATAHVHRFEFADAIGDLDLLLEEDPESSDYLNLKTYVLTNIGEDAEALALYERLVKAHGDQADNWMYYGHALKAAGKVKECVEAYRKGLSMHANAGDGYWNLANVKTHRFSPEDVDRLRAEAAREEASGKPRSSTQFALGKALEDAKDYAASFEHYAKGNAIRRTEIHYSADETTALMRRSKALFTKEFFKKREGQGSPARDPIFIVGLPRCGSTLVEQILASHSQIEGTLELPDIAFLVREILDFEHKPDESRYPAILGNLKGKQLREYGEQYLERTRIQRKLGRPYFTDKALNNAFHIGFIHLILPNAKIIDIRRHPLGNGFAIYRQLFGRIESYFYDLGEIGRYYRDYVEYMAQIDAVLPGRVHRVIYERLVDDPKGETRRLLEYCGVPFEESCLRFYETERGVRTASAEQVRQPIFKDAVGHWRNYEPWLGPMKAALGDVLEAYPNVPRF